MPLNGGNFSWLMLKRVQTVHIAHDRLDRGDQQRHPHRHGKHGADGGGIVTAQQVPCARRADKQRAAQKRGDSHMNQAVREGGIKDDRQPVLRNNLSVFDSEALRRMHPAVGREDPEGRHQRAERHHAG